MMAEPGNPWGRRRSFRAGAAVAGTLVLLTGCAAGQIAQTVRQTPAIEGVNANVGSIALRAVTVAAPKDQSWPKGGDAPLQLIIANAALEADTLTSVTTDAAQSVQIMTLTRAAGEGTASGSASGSASSGSTAPPSGSTPPGRAALPLLVPGRQSVSIGYRLTNPSIQLRGLTEQLFPAQSINVTFNFANAGTVTFPVSVHLTAPPSTRPTLDIAPTAE